MTVTVACEINPVFECTDLLTRFMSGESYAVLKKEIQSKLGIKMPQIEEMLDFLQTVSKGITAEFRKSDDALQLLFTGFGDMDKTPAKAILQFYGDFSEQDPRKIGEGALAAFQESPFSFLYSMLDNYEFLDSSTFKKSENETDILKLMKACSMDDREKWVLLSFYHNFSYYVERLVEILKKAIALFEQYLPALSPLTQPFFADFPQKVNTATIHKYMVENFHLNLPDSHDIFIQPSLFSCSKLQYLEAESPDRFSNILWGIHFEDIFVNQIKWNSSTYLCNNLKILSDKSKFDILRLLASHRSYGGEIAKKLNLTTGTITYHMQALVNSQFVSVDKRGYRTYYELNRKTLDDFLEQVKKRLLQGEK